MCCIWCDKIIKVHCTADIILFVFMIMIILINKFHYKLKDLDDLRNVLIVILLEKIYELYSVRRHWTYPSSKSTGLRIVYGNDLAVVIAIVMYTDRFLYDLN